jgi:hypothetical protein
MLIRLDFIKKVAYLNSFWKFSLYIHELYRWASFLESLFLAILKHNVIILLLPYIRTEEVIGTGPTPTAYETVERRDLGSAIDCMLQSCAE